MNTTILAKCIEELKKETPDISYIRGALETLLEMSAQPAVVAHQPMPQSIPQQTPNVSTTVQTDEQLQDELYKQYVTGPIGKLTNA